MLHNNDLLRSCYMQGRVVSGHKDALDSAQRAAVAKGALKVTPLAVSGAFHTPLMKPAQDSLIKVSMSYLINQICDVTVPRATRHPVSIITCDAII